MKFANFTLAPLLICFVLGVSCSVQFEVKHPFPSTHLLLFSLLSLLIAWIAKKYNFVFKKQKNLLVLTKNTKVNLEAILLKNEIDQSIADGSSYPNIKNRWKKTCRQFDIPFYDAQKEGSYLLSTKTRNIGF